MENTSCFVSKCIASAILTPLRESSSIRRHTYIHSSTPRILSKSVTHKFKFYCYAKNLARSTTSNLYSAIPLKRFVRCRRLLNTFHSQSFKHGGLSTKIFINKVLKFFHEHVTKDIATSEPPRNIASCSLRYFVSACSHDRSHTTINLSSNRISHQNRT